MGDRLRRFLHHPATELVLVGLIVLSVTLILLEPVVAAGSVVRLAVQWTGDALTGLFIVELSLRFVVARNKRRFFRRYWLDIIAVLPLARALRFFRVLRLLRLFRAGLLLNRRLSVFRETFQGAMNQLTILATLTVTIVLVGATMIHLAEGRTNSAFANFHEAVWFSVYSLIGGEPIGGSPSSETGRFVTLLLMLGGMTVFGMFVGTVSAAMMSRLSARMELNEMELDDLNGHVVICGWNRSGPTVVQELFQGAGQEDRAVVIITEEREMPHNLATLEVRPELIYHYSGDYTCVEVLEAVGVSRAALAILLADQLTPRTDQDQDARTVLAGLTIERLAQGIFTCAQLHNPRNAAVLKMAGVEEIVVGDWFSGVILGSVGRTRGLVAVLSEILTTSYGNTFHKLVVPERLAGVTIGELHQRLKQDHSAILMSWEPTAGPTVGVVKVNPDVSLIVQAGDTLVIIAERQVLL